MSTDYIRPIIQDATVVKHMGPGPHPDGSPQKVHGRRGGQAAWRRQQGVDEQGRPVDGAKPSDDDTEYMVGVTGWREKEDREHYITDNQNYDELRKLAGSLAMVVEDVHLAPARGGWEGGWEPSSVITYKGNGAATRLLAEFGAKHNQDAILIVKKGGNEASFDISFDSFVNGKKGAVEEILKVSGIGGWTWLKVGDNKTTLRLCSVPEWNVHLEDDQIAGVVRDLQSKGFRARYQRWASTATLLTHQRYGGENSYAKYSKAAAAAKSTMTSADVPMPPGAGEDASGEEQEEDWEAALPHVDNCDTTVFFVTQASQGEAGKHYGPGNHPDGSPQRVHGHLGGQGLWRSDHNIPSSTRWGEAMSYGGSDRVEAVREGYRGREGFEREPTEGDPKWFEASRAEQVSEVSQALRPFFERAGKAYRTVMDAIWEAMVGITSPQSSIQHEIMREWARQHASDRSSESKFAAGKGIPSEYLRPIIQDASVVKHGGPGPHSGTGTPQGVHGGGMGKDPAYTGAGQRAGAGSSGESSSIGPEGHTVGYRPNPYPGFGPTEASYRLEREWGGIPAGTVLNMREQIDGASGAFDTADGKHEDVLIPLGAVSALGPAALNRGVTSVRPGWEDPKRLSKSPDALFRQATGMTLTASTPSREVARAMKRYLTWDRRGTGQTIASALGKYSESIEFSDSGVRGTGASWQAAVDLDRYLEDVEWVSEKVPTSSLTKRSVLYTHSSGLKARWTPTPMEDGRFDFTLKFLGSRSGKGLDDNDEVWYSTDGSQKHGGPGPHESGSSQSVHGGGGPSAMPKTEFPQDLIDALVRADKAVEKSRRELENAGRERVNDSTKPDLTQAHMNAVDNMAEAGRRLGDAIMPGLPKSEREIVGRMAMRLYQGKIDKAEWDEFVRDHPKSLRVPRVGGKVVSWGNASWVGTITRVSPYGYDVEWGENVPLDKVEGNRKEGRKIFYVTNGDAVMPRNPMIL